MKVRPPLETRVALPASPTDVADARLARHSRPYAVIATPSDAPAARSTAPHVTPHQRALLVNAIAQPSQQHLLLVQQPPPVALDSSVELSGFLVAEVAQVGGSGRVTRLKEGQC